MSVLIPEHIAAQVAHYFERGAFERGLAYAREGRVSLVKAGWPAVAQVRGTEGYVTTVYYSNPTLPSRDMHGDCSCPVALDCKHVVATAVVALAREDVSHDSWEIVHKQEQVGTWLSQLSLSIDKGQGEGASRNAVVYIISGERVPSITVNRCTRRKRGGFGRTSVIAGVADPARGVPSWVPVEDLRLITMLRAVGRTGGFGTAIEMTRLGAQELRDLAATERLFWERTTSPPLIYAEPMSGSLAWREIADTPGEFRVDLDSELALLPAGQCHYVDPVQSRIGPLDVGVSAPVLQELLRAPPVPEGMLSTVRRSLAPLLTGEAATALVGDAEQADVLEDELQPHLYVGLSDHRNAGALTDPQASAVYGEQRFELAAWDPDRPHPRNMVQEGRFKERLAGLLEDFRPDRDGGSAMAHLAEARFVAQVVVPTLVDEGWTCELDEDYPVEPPVTPASWIEALSPRNDSPGWFALELGVVVQGRTVSLLPILLAAIRDGDLPLDTQLFDARALPGINLELPDGQLVYVSGARIQRWLRPLLELQMRGLDEAESLRVPDFVAVDVASAAPGRFSGGTALEDARARVEALIELEPRHESTLR